MRSLAALALSFALAAPGIAQTHSRTPLVLGQNATFSVTNAPPGAFVLLALGANGLGPGACLPAPYSVCLGIVDPIVFFAGGAVAYGLARRGIGVQRGLE